MLVAIKIVAIYFLALLSAVWLIRILRPVALAVGLIDVPDNRKSHKGEVPLVGGIAIWVLLGVAFAITQIFYHDRLAGAAGYFAGASLLVVVGVLDDIFEISVWIRFTVQAFVALVVIIVGHAVLSNLGDLWGTGDVLTGLWAIPFSMFCIVGLINAFNMLDGITGLAGLIALSALFWFLLFALNTGRTVLGIAVMLFAGVLTGFLISNLRYPWRQELTFLGDAGSTLLGFTLTWCAILASQAPAFAITPAAALWILGLPVLETVSLMLRRIMHMRSPIQGGRDHLHHLLLAYGWSERATVLGEVTFALILGGIGYFGWYYHIKSQDLSVGFVVIGVFYLIAVDIAWRLLVQRSEKLKYNEPV